VCAFLSLVPLAIWLTLLARGFLHLSHANQAAALPPTIDFGTVRFRGSPGSATLRSNGQ
jgi:hypothetical protein